MIHHSNPATGFFIVAFVGKNGMKNTARILKE
jgi:hypothetical protein